jgi:hypothetical protein
MNDVTPDKIKDLLDTAIKTNTAAWTAQSNYFDELVKRNVTSFATLADARTESLKQISESQTFNEAFEANIAYEDTVRDEMNKLYEENRQAWEELQNKIKSIYKPDSGDEAAA